MSTFESSREDNVGASAVIPSLVIPSAVIPSSVISTKSPDDSDDTITNEHVRMSLGAKIAEFNYKRKLGKVSGEYLHPVQISDAIQIANLFTDQNKLVVSVSKKTQTGSTGAMIALLVEMVCRGKMTPSNCLILTGANMTSWESMWKEKLPSCFSNIQYHQGRFHKIKNIASLKNSLIVVDECHFGSEEQQRIHGVLSPILDVDYLAKNNVRIVMVSATMRSEIQELNRWGDRHSVFKMTIGPTYVGVKEFYDLGLIEQNYRIETAKDARRWITRILQVYPDQMTRVHLFRRTKADAWALVKEVATANGFLCVEYDSTNRLSNEDLSRLFTLTSKTQHVIIGVLGFFRMSTSLPIEWKRRVGSIFEAFTGLPTQNTIIQGLIGRITRYDELFADLVQTNPFGPYFVDLETVKAYIAEKPDTNGGRLIFASPEHVTNITNFAPSLVTPKKKGRWETCDLTEPSDLDSIKKWARRVFRTRITTYELFDHQGVPKITYRNDIVKLFRYESKDSFKIRDIYGGLSSSMNVKSPCYCRIMPVAVHPADSESDWVKWIGIYLRDAYEHATKTNLV